MKWPKTKLEISGFFPHITPYDAQNHHMVVLKACWRPNWSQNIVEPEWMLLFLCAMKTGALSVALIPRLPPFDLVSFLAVISGENSCKHREFALIKSVLLWRLLNNTFVNISCAFLCFTPEWLLILVQMHQKTFSQRLWKLFFTRYCGNGLLPGFNCLPSHVYCTSLAVRQVRQVGRRCRCCCRLAYWPEAPVSFPYMAWHEADMKTREISLGEIHSEHGI